MIVFFTDEYFWNVFVYITINLCYEFVSSKKVQTFKKQAKILRIFNKNFFFILSFQYNIKKKEEVVEQLPQEEPNPLMRKKKTPEELAAEAEAEDLDDFTSKFLLSSLSIFFLSLFRFYSIYL